MFENMSTVYRQIVENYQKLNGPRFWEEFRYYATADDIDHAVKKACESKAPFCVSDKSLPKKLVMSSHQRRIRKGLMNECVEKFTCHLDEVKRCKSFAELYETVGKVIGGTKGIGEVTDYDVALRFGAYLNKPPQRVYLHAGALEGARAIFGNDPQKREKPKSGPTPLEWFPEEFQELQPAELENLLCVCKGCLNEGSSIGPSCRCLMTTRHGNC